MNMNNCVRWGIVGTGDIANKFARAVTNAQGAKPVAVASRRAETARAFADTYGIEYSFGSYEELMAFDGVDAVYIALPHKYHVPYTEKFLRAGKHVLCEKPIAVSAGELERLQAVAAEKNLFVMEAMWTRFLPVMSEIKKVIADGKIGDVLEVSADFCYNNPDHSHHAFAGDGDGGSVLDVGIYGLNFALMFLGEDVQRVQAMARMENNADLNMNALLQFKSGAMARVSSALALDKPQLGYIYGSRGHICVPAFYGASEFDVVVDGETVTHTAPFKGNGFEEEIEEACRCILAGKAQSSIMPLTCSMTVLKLMDEIRGQLGIVCHAE
ncbi:MAG: Gfo/Idh/MocA family oxidoreductase [Oscillospiraceae bacterium]|nr:Gfo/Idh/MocA family oxidoreductase [Oscillospiraceae bacterium]